MSPCHCLDSERAAGSSTCNCCCSPSERAGGSSAMASTAQVGVGVVQPRSPPNPQVVEVVTSSSGEDEGEADSF